MKKAIIKMGKATKISDQWYAYLMDEDDKKIGRTISVTERKALTKLLTTNFSDFQIFDSIDSVVEFYKKTIRERGFDASIKD